MRQVEGGHGLDEPALVRCRSCRVEMSQEVAQAARWRYWRETREDAFPLCAACAEQRFGKAGDG